MKSSPFVVVTACVFVAGLSAACELFTGEIACEDDADCPADREFCVAGKCNADEDGGRDGRGVDGLCDTDDDCADSHGLCDVEGSFAAAGTCLPAADDATANCGEDTDVVGAGGPRFRAATGPVIFAVSATPIGDGCYSDVTFEYFQREPQPFTNGFIELVVDGANLTQGGPGDLSNDRTIAVQTMCGAAIGKPAGLVFDLGGASNVACLPVAE